MKNSMPADWNDTDSVCGTANFLHRGRIMSDLYGPDDVTRDASISECGLYRYSMIRQWDSSLPPQCWIMLNPSTADDSVDDPTIRRVCAFSRAWGRGGIIVVNLFALRATDPAELSRAGDPVGPQNDEAIRQAIFGLTVIAAWGAHPFARQRSMEVVKMLPHVNLRCLGVTKDGFPRHPLYVAGNMKLVTFGGKP